MTHHKHILWGDRFLANVFILNVIFSVLGEYSSVVEYLTAGQRSKVWYSLYYFELKYLLTTNTLLLLLLSLNMRDRTTSQPLAIAKPPPSSRMMFHGTHSWAFFQDRRGTYGTLDAVARKLLLTQLIHFTVTMLLLSIIRTILLASRLYWIVYITTIV